MNLILMFIGLTILNVIMSTIKSIVTIKCGKYMATIINAVYYGYYTIVAIYTVTLDFDTMTKALITFGCNLVGVFIVKLLEEKARKDKLWKVELTVKEYETDNVCDFLNTLAIPYNYIIDATETYAIFNVYCATQSESMSVRELVKKFRAKYFVAESKEL